LTQIEAFIGLIEQFFQRYDADPRRRFCGID
jgi:hypothetical protein